MIVFITRFGNSFDGNLKYLFLYINSIDEKDIKYYFLTEKKEIQKDLKACGLPVLIYPGIKSFFKLLITKIIIVDGNEWIRKLKYHILFNSHKIQLWHGSGIKTVGLLKPDVKKRNFIINAISRSIGHHPYYDRVFLSSKFQVKTRGKAFRCRKIDINGQPRNDIFFRNDFDKYTIGVDEDIINRCSQLKGKGRKLILYTPTWRESSREEHSLNNALDIDKLNDFAEKHKLIFIFKLHNKSDFTINSSATKNILEYEKSKDIYPLFKLTDCMITDYSSIYIDYLLLNKPVIFFPFDYDYYVHKERALQVDYNKITSGIKCFSQIELEEAIYKVIVQGKDSYIKQRKEVLSVFYDYIDGNSSERIWNYVKGLFK